MLGLPNGSNTIFLSYITNVIYKILCILCNVIFLLLLCIQTICNIGLRPVLFIRINYYYYEYLFFRIVMILKLGHFSKFILNGTVLRWKIVFAYLLLKHEYVTKYIIQIIIL